MPDPSPRNNADADREALITLTRRLGLTALAASTYVLLLEHGPLRAKEVAATMASAEEEVVAALDLPVALGLVAQSRDKRRLLLYATDPETAFLALSAQVVWRSKASLAPVRSLPPTDLPKVEETRALFAQIAEHARRLYKPQGSVRLHKEFDAETADELGRLTCELIATATNRIRAMSRTPRLPVLGTFWTVLSDRITAGVQYTRVADLQEFFDHGLLIKRRDMTEMGVELFMLESSRVTQSYLVVDSRYLSTTHQRGEDGGVYQGFGRVTSQRTVVDRYRKRFDKMLPETVPGPFVVERLQHAAERLIASARQVLDADEIPWLESLVDWGGFTTYAVDHGWSAQRIAEVARRASEAGLVRRNHASAFVPAYPTDEAAIRAEYSMARMPQSS